MNNITSILILIFLAITFYNLDTTNFFLERQYRLVKGHFEKTPLKIKSH
jgi:hypothetical protein